MWPSSCRELQGSSRTVQFGELVLDTHLPRGEVTAPRPNLGDLSVCGPIKLFLPAYRIEDPHTPGTAKDSNPRYICRSFANRPLSNGE